MKERTIKIRVVAPVECTDEQFLEWCEFCVGSAFSMSNDNPLVDYDLEAESVDI